MHTGDTQTLSMVFCRVCSDAGIQHSSSWKHGKPTYTMHALRSSTWLPERFDYALQPLYTCLSQCAAHRAGQRVV